jgi:hypothetical protein
MLRRTGRLRSRSRLAGLLLVATATAAACGGTSGASATLLPTAAQAGTQTAAPSASIAAPTPSPALSPAPSAKPPCCTPSSFWAAVTRGLAAARHLQVTASGPSPGVLRFEPSASATMVNGTVVFVCIGGAAYDGQSGFARVPGKWTCGAGALASGFRQIGQPADSWSANSPGDASITESVTVGSDRSWTWAYTGISPFLGGRITARVSLDPATGRIRTAQRTDPTGTTTYAFDYVRTFPALAVPAH